MQLENNINNENIIQSNIEIEKSQNNFLESTLGKTINAAFDIGLRWILPDLVENEIINIKNSFIQEGLAGGINTAINTAVNFGKSALGIFTGKFESVSQVQSAIRTGGIIDGISDVIDNVISKVNKSGMVDSNILNLIRQGKNVILENVSKNIEEQFTIQLNNMEKLAKYENNWKQYYKDQDFVGMEREFTKIKEKLKELIPLENVLKEARTIENLHILIKNNNQNFNLNNEQLELAKMLT